jgi:hypothetical protein
VFKELSQEEQHNYLSVSTRIGHLRRLARKCGMDPNDLLYTRKIKGTMYVFPGKLLLENELPEVPKNCTEDSTEEP